MFGRIACGYDRANRLLSGGLDILWRRRMVAEVIRALNDAPPFAGGAADQGKRPAGHRVLDLAAGTMDVSLGLAEALPGSVVLAADFCLPMLLAGEVKRQRRQPCSSAGRILPLAADGFALPLPAHAVHAVTLAFGLRNMQPRSAALAEIFRVLTPGGRLYVLEFGSAGGKLWGGLYNIYLRHLLPRVGGLLAGDRAAYDYLATTIEEFPPAGELGREMLAVGFCSVRPIRLSGGIVFLHIAEK